MFGKPKNDPGEPLTLAQLMDDNGSGMTLFHQLCVTVEQDKAAGQQLERLPETTWAKIPPQEWSRIALEYRNPLFCLACGGGLHLIPEAVRGGIPYEAWVQNGAWLFLHAARKNQFHLISVHVLKQLPVSIWLGFIGDYYAKKPLIEENRESRAKQRPYTQALFNEDIWKDRFADFCKVAASLRKVHCPFALDIRIAEFQTKLIAKQLTPRSSGAASDAARQRDGRE